MEREIERKFLVKKLPKLDNSKKIRYERYFLKIGNDIEERIQRKGESYEYERKIRISIFERKTEKKKITSTEFDALKKNSTKSIIRDSYPIPEINGGSIKIYHGDFNGLIRAEFEFNTIEEANNFKKLEWLGEEITETPLGNDSQLINLNKDQFKNLLEKLG